MIVLFLLAGCRGGSTRSGVVSLNRSASSISDEIKRKGTPLYLADAHAYISLYPPDRIEQARLVYDLRLIPGMEAGLVALYQRCTHLGCRVPWCLTSQYFECPCHKSLYDRAGERRGGPAPRGLDHMPLLVSGGGDVAVDTSVVIPGPPPGTDTTGQTPAGPHCIGTTAGD